MSRISSAIHAALMAAYVEKKLGCIGERPIRILPGQYYDAETGLNYNYYRDYDPTIGRYIESDPIGLQGGLNMYGYVGGNPIGDSDQEGLSGNFTTDPVRPRPIGPPWEVFNPGSPTNDIFRNTINRLVKTIEDLCKQPCPPCTPYAAGTIGYIGPHYDHDHYPVGRPHLNLFVVRQRPSDCKCFWNKNDPDVAKPPPSPGWVDLNNGFPPLSP
jgi:RHS repeat-associated protein